MSEDINVTDGTVLESLNNKVDIDGGNYVGSPLEAYIHEHCSGANSDLSNLSSTGQAKFNEKANVNLSNLSSTGQAKFDEKANLDLSNLSSTGEAKFSAKVNKSGDTMTGNLTISKNTPTINMTGTGWKGITSKSTDVDYTSTAATEGYGVRLLSQDKNGKTFGYVQTGFNSSGVTYSAMNIKRSIGGTEKQANLGVYLDTSGNGYAVAPHSAVNNSIVTQAGLSKAANGYMKLGNGMIIQWGKATTPATVTLPIAFSNTNYVVTVGGTLPKNSDNYQNLSAINLTTTSMKLVFGAAEDSSYAMGCFWIAIGW